MFRSLVISCTSFTFSTSTLKSCYSDSPVPAGDNALEPREIPDEKCHINRYGYFKATITIVGKTTEERC